MVSKEYKYFKKSIVRFLSKVKVEVSGCWWWQGYREPRSGYGTFSFKKRPFYAHRASYYFFYTDPGKLFVCHTCDNSSCVNPEHLWLGTQADNMLDMDKKGRRKNQNSYKTHCKRGHKFDKENTHIDTSGGRHCRACHRVRCLEHYYRKKKS